MQIIFPKSLKNIYSYIYLKHHTSNKDFSYTVLVWAAIQSKIFLKKIGFVPNGSNSSAEEQGTFGFGLEIHAECGETLLDRHNNMQVSKAKQTTRHMFSDRIAVMGQELN